MKYVRLVFLIMFLTYFTVKSQNKQLLYDFNEVPQSLLLNPGIATSYKWYMGFPIFSGIYVQAAISGVTVNDLFAIDGVDFNTKFREKIVYGLTDKDELSGTYQIDLISAGYRSKKNENIFYSFGAYNEGDMIGYFFKDYALLAFEGNTNNIDKVFDLSDLKTRGDLLNVYHFGINNKASDKLSFGFRGKIYASFVNFGSTKNNGYFLTTQGQNNTLRSTLVADIQIRTSGILELKDVIDDPTLNRSRGISNILLNRALLGGNLGLGFDLGFTYSLNEQTSITGSLLDLGFVYHNKDVSTYSLKGIANTEGLEVILPDDLANSGEDLWLNLVEGLENLVPYVQSDDDYIAFRPTKLNASVRRDFGEVVASRSPCNCTSKVGRGRSRNAFKNSMGVHLYAINRPRGPQTALTAFYQYRFGNSASVKTTYTIDKFSYGNLGIGGSIQWGPMNIYFTADNLLSYRNIANSHYVSLQFGINSIFWGKN